MENDLSRLQALIGLKLSITSNAANMRIFHFGDIRETTTHFGKTGYVGMYALHIQCNWRIEHKGRLIAGSDDYFHYAGPGVEPADWQPQDGNRADSADLSTIISTLNPETRQLFNLNDSLRVENVSSSQIGDVTVEMSGDYVLRLFCTTHRSEAWRLLAPGKDNPHLVFPQEVDDAE